MDKSTRKFSLSHRIRSFKFAISGLKFMFKNEHNSRIHVVAAVLSILAGFYFEIGLLEWCLLVFAIGIVFISEIINSALEYTIDLYSKEFSENAKRAKDLAAAGVFVAAIISVIIGLIIFLPKIYFFIKL